MDHLKSMDPDVFASIASEAKRPAGGMELIACADSVSRRGRGAAFGGGPGR